MTDSPPCNIRDAWETPGLDPDITASIQPTCGCDSHRLGWLHAQCNHHGLYVMNFVQTCFVFFDEQLWTVIESFAVVMSVKIIVVKTKVSNLLPVIYIVITCLLINICKIKTNSKQNKFSYYLCYHHRTI